MSGTVIRPIHLMTHKLYMDDNAITRTLASNMLFTELMQIKDVTRSA
jgi:hypothetical protein